MLPNYLLQKIYSDVNRACAVVVGDVQNVTWSWRLRMHGGGQEAPSNAHTFSFSHAVSPKSSAENGQWDSEKHKYAYRLSDGTGEDARCLSKGTVGSCAISVFCFCFFYLSAFCHFWWSSVVVHKNFKYLLVRITSNRQISLELLGCISS